MVCLCFGRRKGDNGVNGASYVRRFDNCKQERLNSVKNQVEKPTARHESVSLPATVSKDIARLNLDVRANNVKETGLTQLPAPAAETPSSKLFNVDIVAVHGLGGHPFKTWTFNEKGKECFWLQDYLLEDLPGARLYTFGYNSHPFLSRSVETIADYAKELIDNIELERLSLEAVCISFLNVHLVSLIMLLVFGADSFLQQSSRPIIFICHSMGGLVCKQVSRYRSLEITSL